MDSNPRDIKHPGERGQIPFPWRAGKKNRYLTRFPPCASAAPPATGCVLRLGNPSATLCVSV